MVVVVGMVALLHSVRFHAYLLRTAQQKVGAALGSQVQIRDFALRWAGVSPTLDAYAVIVHGSGPDSSPPLFEADAIHFGITVTSLLHQAWYVDDIRIEHPVVHLVVDKDGHSNLPSPRNAKAGTAPSVDLFDLGIRHLRLERGTIFYNDRKSELNADLRDLLVQSSFNLLTRTYSGTLSYRDGHFRMRNGDSIGHALNARFAATSQEFKLESADLSAGNSKLSVIASVRDYSQLHAHATYQALVDIGKLRGVFHNASLPTGMIQSSGVIDYSSQDSTRAPDQSLLAVVIAHGEAHSAGLTITSNNTQVKVTNLGARYEVKKGDAAITGIHANVLGGALTGTCWRVILPAHPGRKCRCRCRESQSLSCRVRCRAEWGLPRG